MANNTSYCVALNIPMITRSKISGIITSSVYAASCIFNCHDNTVSILITIIQ